jgi:hypothetical protein
MFLKFTLGSLIWALAGAATVAQAVGVESLDPNLPTLIYSDAFPDDFVSFVRSSVLFRETRGRALMVVMVDGPAEAKARSIHNMLHFFAMPEATVLAGESNIIDPNSEHFIDYTRDYEVPEFANVLSVLSTSTEPRPWINDNYRELTKRFFNRYQQVQVLMQSNPASFNTIKNEFPVPHIRQIYGLGPGKTGPGGDFITAFNENRNVVAAEEFFRWVKETRAPYFGISTSMIADLSRVEEATISAKRKLMSSTSHGSVLVALDRALGAFIAAVRQNLFQNRGSLMDYVLITDPKHGGWNQDPTLLEVALDPARYCSLEGFDLEIDLTKRHSSGLGYLVKSTPNPGSKIVMATSLNVEAVAESMAAALTDVKVTPNFSAERLLAARTARPTAFIGKGSIDDEGALMAHIALGDLKLVIAESSRSAEIAERYRRTLLKYGQKTVITAAGRGHSWAQMQADKALGLEFTVASAGGLSVGLLSDQERAEINGDVLIGGEKDPSTLSAADALEQFLRNNPGAVVHDTASGATLLAVLKRSPELVKNLAEVHLMGGFRDAKKAGTRGYEGGIVSRCWLNDDEQKELFAILEAAKIPTWLAASHHSGGAANDVNMPLYTAQLRAAESKLPIARLQRGFREAWNEPLKAKLDPKTGLGPPLGYLGAVRIAFGPKASDPYFSATAGRFVFHGGGKVDFIPDETSSIRMLDLFQGYGSLDQTMALLQARAVAKAPRDLFGRALEGAKSCAVWLRNRVTGGGQNQ